MARQRFSQASAAVIAVGQNLAARKWNHPRLFALVALGGAIGSLLRYAVSLALPPNLHIFGQTYIATLIVNVVGSFILGFLLEALSRLGPETARQQQIRLLIGTGICGGFTTYSTFALEASQLLGLGLIVGTIDFDVIPLLIALGYIGGTIGLGTLAALGGVAVGSRFSLPNKVDAR